MLGLVLNYVLDGLYITFIYEKIVRPNDTIHPPFLGLAGITGARGVAGINGGKLTRANGELGGVDGDYGR